MNNFKARWFAVPAAGVVLTGVAALFLAPTASAAEATPSTPTTSSSDSGTPQVLANVGKAANHFLDHLQYEHLDQPLLGFGPAIEDPTGWATGHLVPVFLDTASLALTGQEAGNGG